MDIGEKLKKIRTLEGLKQTELADILKITSTSVIRFESGKQKPRYEVIQKLCAKFPKYVRFLMLDDQAPPENESDATVPILTWSQVGQIAANPNAFFNNLSTFDDQVLHVMSKGLETTLSEHAFGLRLDVSDLSNYDPAKIDDELAKIEVIVDPMTPLKPQSTAVISDKDKIRYGVYFEFEDKKYIKPINPDYPAIELSDEFVYIGTVAQTTNTTTPKRSLD